jgi:hypothetical protein
LRLSRRLVQTSLTFGELRPRAVLRPAELLLADGSDDLSLIRELKLD